MSNIKEIDEMKNLIDPNSNKYSGIITQMHYKTKHKYEFVFVNLPVDMSEDDRNKLVKWYRFFGDKDYKYSLSKDSIVGEIINKK